MFGEFFAEIFGWLLLDLIGASVRFVFCNLFYSLVGKETKRFKYYYNLKKDVWGLSDNSFVNRIIGAFIIVIIAVFIAFLLKSN